jgi:hypothetical protein
MVMASVGTNLLADGPDVITIRGLIVNFESCSEKLHNDVPMEIPMQLCIMVVQIGLWTSMLAADVSHQPSERIAVHRRLVNKIDDLG